LGEAKTLCRHRAWDVSGREIAARKGLGECIIARRHPGCSESLAFDSIFNIRLLRLLDLWISKAAPAADYPTQAR